MSRAAVDVHVARESNQFANLANLFFKRLLRQFAAEFGFHFSGSFKLYRQKTSSSNALSIFTCEWRGRHRQHAKAGIPVRA
jgi:hypothetical protein